MSPDSNYFSPRQLAKRWGMTEQTLANWRCLNKGPPAIRIANRVRYPVKLIYEWEEEQLKEKLKTTTGSWLTQDN